MVPSCGRAMRINAYEVSGSPALQTVDIGRGSLLFVVVYESTAGFGADKAFDAQHVVCAVGSVGVYHYCFSKMTGNHGVIVDTYCAALPWHNGFLVPSGLGAAAGGFYIGYQQRSVSRIGESEHAIAVRALCYSIIVMHTAFKSDDGFMGHGTALSFCIVEIQAT